MSERFFIYFDDEITKTQCLEVKALVEKATGLDVQVNSDYDALMVMTYIQETANLIRVALDNVTWPDDLYLSVVYPDGGGFEHFPH